VLGEDDSVTRESGDMPRLSSADRALVDRLLAGDQEAFSTLVKQYHQQMLRVVSAFVSSQAVAEEVVQETWLAILKGLPTFQGRSSLKTWMFTILTNRAKTRGVREGRTVPFSALGDGSDDPAVESDRFDAKGHWMQPPTAAPDELFERQEAMVHVQQAVDDLPANQRAVVTLRDVQGWSSEEVCNLLGISETNQRVLLHRGRSKVRKILEKTLKDGE
jgi:RNA polymerase sigma-70 factor (ECF subfamily)